MYLCLMQSLVMATSISLKPVVKVGAAIGSIVDITDQVSAATLTVTAEALEDTAFGSTSRTMTAGLFNSLTLTVYASYAASESYAVVTTPRHKVHNQSKPNQRSRQRNRPGFILTDTYLSSIPVAKRIAWRIEHL